MPQKLHKCCIVDLVMITKFSFGKAKEAKEFLTSHYSNKNNINNKTGMNILDQRVQKNII